MSKVSEMVAVLWGEDIAVGSFDAVKVAEKLHGLGITLQPEWVSVETEMPKSAQVVDVLNGKTRYTDFIWFPALEVWRSKSTRIQYPKHKFTHWMNVPEFPSK